MKNITSSAAAMVLPLISATAIQAQSFSGEASAWAQFVQPTNTDRGGDDCEGDSPSDEYCTGVAGAGLYAGALIALPSGGLVYADLNIDGHLASTDDDPARASENARYAGLGLHYIIDDGTDPWGVYATVVRANNHVDTDDTSGVMAGLGAEKYWGTYYVQGGFMLNTADGADTDDIGDDDIDGMVNFAYLRTGSEWALANGTVDGSLAAGRGKATGLDEDAATMNWVQLAVTYSAPIDDTDLEWFVGYQGDYVDGVEADNTGFEGTMLNSLQAGITINFGDRQSPFKTPNFRAPVSNAGELN